MEIIDHGVCRLSVVPVRKSPSDQSELVTQLLFGDDYAVIERGAENKWFKIRIIFDHYEGWISAAQHHSVSKEYVDYIARAEFKITTDITSSLLYNKTPLHILIGSIIPISGSELFKMEEQFAFNGQSKSLGLKREFEFLKQVALKYLNAPYLWGGKNPFGVDCSGFVQMVFKISGYRLFRDAWQQASQGKAVKSFEQVAPGDLAFFKNSENKITHVGIVLEDNRIIHASGKVRIDHLNDQGILSVDSKIYTHELSHIRRILA
jgi:gamma-D-glutamyl-L-lysine dipeptidyl-peptidase